MLQAAVGVVSRGEQPVELGSEDGGVYLVHSTLTKATTTSSRDLGILVLGPLPRDLVGTVDEHGEEACADRGGDIGSADLDPSARQLADVARQADSSGGAEDAVAILAPPLAHGLAVDVVEEGGEALGDDVEEGGAAESWHVCGTCRISDSG